MLLSLFFLTLMKDWSKAIEAILQHASVPNIVESKDRGSLNFRRSVLVLASLCFFHVRENKPFFVLATFS